MIEEMVEGMIEEMIEEVIEGMIEGMIEETINVLMIVKERLLVNTYLLTLTRNNKKHLNVPNHQSVVLLHLLHLQSKHQLHFNRLFLKAQHHLYKHLLVINSTS